MAYYDKLKIQSSWFKLIQSIFVLQAELKISLHLRRYTVFLFPTGVKSERNHKIICITGNGFYADDQTLSPTILLRATFSNQGMKLYRRERAGKTYVSPISEASANARNVRFSNTLSRRERKIPTASTDLNREMTIFPTLRTCKCMTRSALRALNLKGLLYQNTPTSHPYSFF